MADLKFVNTAVIGQIDGVALKISLKILKKKLLPSFFYGPCLPRSPEPIMHRKVDK